MVEESPSYLDALIIPDLNPREFDQIVNEVADQEQSDKIKSLAIDQMEYLKKVKAIKDLFWRFVHERDEVISKILSCVKNIEEHNHNSKIAKTSGNGAGIFGGALFLGGLLAAPFTAGASLAASAAGAGISAAGGATSIGTDIALDRIVKRISEEGNNHINDSNQSLEDLKNSIEELQRWIDNLGNGNLPKEEKTNYIACVLSGGNFLYKLGMAGVEFSSISRYATFAAKYTGGIIGFGKAAMTPGQLKQVESIGTIFRWLGNGKIANMAVSVSKNLAKISGVLCVVGIALDGWGLFKNIKSLVEKDLNEASVELLKTGRDLLDQVWKLGKFLESLTGRDTYIKKGYFKNGLGTVLDVAGFGKNMGTQIHMWSKHGESNQQWFVRSDGMIQNYDNLLFMDVQWGNIENGTGIHCWEKNSSAAQKWKFFKDGIIGTELCEKVLDVEGANPGLGARPVIWPKHGANNQIWTFEEIIPQD